ncbi:MAG: ferredoxin family protein [Propionibacteriaceae bacterium]|nr:ferredoxin family protein [Propionibacteriaceae bacterium]
MAYVVTEKCIRSKYQDCVEVCPTGCFYEGENMLVINPDECISCGSCADECTAEAIIEDTEAGAEQWVEFNRKYAALWPKITSQGEVPEDADEWRDVEDKLQFFSEAPGKGDA